MKITRKDFLRLTGLSVLAGGSGQVVRTTMTGGRVQASGQDSRVRWGMVIDIAKCKREAGCDKCIRACDSAHNVPHIADHAHEVKWVWKQSFASVFPFAQTSYSKDAESGVEIPLLCNHCANPPCTRVCPAQATWKRKDGVVMMDWHRCIGCRYCVAACPYGSRSFNWQDPRPALTVINPEFPTRTKGVVEKCNFCEERLAQGLKPACVEACPEQVFTFGNLEDPDSPPRQLLRSRFAVQRKPELGTQPSVFYLV
jgi:molybdopterin-containing oxidoreductase family iron-sulfur binding subunit